MKIILVDRKYGVGKLISYSKEGLIGEFEDGVKTYTHEEMDKYLESIDLSKDPDMARW